jgi:dTDP-4-amino-4,6-dideoxygalactose transaminase
VRVPFVDLRRQYRRIRTAIDAALRRVLETQQFILGPEVENLESAMSRYFGVKHSIAVASGTDALEIALQACGVAPGDTVVTSPFTFFATAAAIHNRGATPVLADIEPATFNIDPERVRRILAQRADRRRVKALMPVHLYGRAADMKPLLELAERHDALVIEDAAQAIGAQYGGKYVGAIGTVGCFSFYPTKNLGAYGDGGLVTTNDDEVAAKVRALRDHGTGPGHLHRTVGHSSRLDALQAAVLNAKLPYLDTWTRLRRRNAAFYDDGLAGLRDVETPHTPDRQGHVFNLYTLRIRGGRRNDLRAFLSAEGVETGLYYPRPVHLQPAFWRIGYKAGRMPASEAASEEVLSLPIFPELTGEEKQYVVSKIRSYLKR